MKKLLFILLIPLVLLSGCTTYTKDNMANAPKFIVYGVIVNYRAINNNLSTIHIDRGVLVLAGYDENTNFTIDTNLIDLSNDIEIGNIYKLTLVAGGYRNGVLCYHLYEAKELVDK